MAAAPRSLVLGFLDVVRESAELFRGGYLIATDYGRPIEFHYTSQASVPRSHQLLYGPDFEPIFFADHLAKPMTDRQSSAPQLIVVGSPALVRLRGSIPAPVVHVTRAAEGSSFLAHTHPDHPKDRAVFEKVAGLVPPGFDWLEILERVRGALSEVKESVVPVLAA
jgi:hypothetical protein